MNYKFQYIPDFDLSTSFDEIDEFEKDLSAEEETLLQEILLLEQQANPGTNLMSDLLNAVKKGSLEYVDSMTDTNDSLTSMKRSDSVSQWDDVEVAPINTSANREEAEAFKPRTMGEANKSAIANVSELTTQGMSQEGKKTFERYAEAYSQRTKSLTQMSKKGQTINRSDPDVNNETLSGLRGYRIGPVVAMPTAEEAKAGYEEYAKNNGSKGPSKWLYDENMKQFDTELAKQLGFSSPSEAEKWRKENKLTVHEGPDGMFLVPSDVHSSARHNGYRSKMSQYIRGEVTEEEMKAYVRAEKIAYAKHEVRERGTRMLKGVGLGMIKDLMKCAIVVLVEETYSEFKQKCEEKFLCRMMRILKKCWERVKNKSKELISNLWKNIKNSLLSELLTALNDFFFKTFKNIFKVVRQMWSSIKNAFKILCNSKYSWEEKIYEAAKILSSGIVAIIGFSLNELIEKGLMAIGIPFASFISECLSGLFAGIMSAVVMMLFDNLKSKFKAKSAQVKLIQKNSKKRCMEICHIAIDSLRFYKQLDENIAKALSPFTLVRLEGSQNVARLAGVPEKDIVKTTTDVDVFIQSLKK